MKRYFVNIKEKALNDLKKLERNEPKSYQKALKLIAELYEHPFQGTGHPELLKGKPENRWSRHISEKHQMIYQVFENEVIVLVISAYGHYAENKLYIF